MWHVLAQADPDAVPPVDDSIGWEWMLIPLSGTFGILYLLYLVFLIWMVVFCVRRDPERYLWLLMIFLLQPIGVFIYFVARWLPNRDVELPNIAQRWTRRRELRRLETAALQIGNAHQYVQYGDALRSLKRASEALTAYQNALKKEPDNLAALWGAAVVEHELQQYDAALEHLQKVLDVDAGYKFGDVSLLFGKTLGALGREEEALDHFEKHTRKWRQPQAMFLLAKLYHSAGKPQQAQSTLQSLILDIDSSPRAIARKHQFWKGRARRFMKKIPAS